MRYGGRATNANNVLEGTPFQQLGRSAQITVRAKYVVNANSTDEAERKVSLNIGSQTLVDSIVRQQAGGLTGASDGAGSSQGENVGLSDCDIVYRGLVPPGTLTLSFEDTGSGIVGYWDVSSP